MTTINQPERFTADKGREPSRGPKLGVVPRPAGKSRAGELRSAPRRPAALVPSITGVRVPPHANSATLLNISASGVLLECTGRLPLGTAVTVFFDGTFSPTSVDSRVTRSAVASMNKKGVLRYHIGLAFNSPIVFEDTPESADIPEPEAAPPPALVVTPTPAVIGNRW